MLCVLHRLHVHSCFATELCQLRHELRPGVKYAIGSNIVSISLFKKPHELTGYPAGKPAFNITFPFKVKMF